MSSRTFLRLIPLVILAAAAIACRINLGGPDLPTETIPVSTEAVTSLDEAWSTALEGSEATGSFTLVINESQLTSLITQSLEKQANPPIKDAQVFLRDGQLQLYGTATRGNLEATIRLILSVGVDADGYPQIRIVSGEFGPFPLPEDVLNGLSAVIDEAFTGEIGPIATGIRLESIVIDGGLMAITGRVR